MDMHRKWTKRFWHAGSKAMGFTIGMGALFWITGCTPWGAVSRSETSVPPEWPPLQLPAQSIQPWPHDSTYDIPPIAPETPQAVSDAPPPFAHLLPPPQYAPEIADQQGMATGIGGTK